MTLPAQHFSVSIQRSADDVYAFVSNPLNLPQWALGLSTTITKVDDQWEADSPMGKVTLKFAEPNMFGVADHAVTLASGQTFQNPMRAIPNGDGCELMFTLFRQPEMSNQDYAKDAETILKDLLKVKEVLEQ
jgi:hypothetical protein